MTDEKYVFRETEKERKRLARGAYSKVSGAKSKKCKMPSEYLTEGERKKLNGPEESYNLNKQYEWEEFKKLPVDIQQLYMQNLIDKHGARAEDIAAYLGTNAGNLGNWNWRHKIKLKYMGHKTQSEAWRRFINDSVLADEVVSEPVEEPKAPETPSSCVKPDDLLHLTNGEVFMTGNPAAIFEKMMLLLDNSKKYTIRIGFFET
jgi:hypothetical protein